MVPIAHRLPSFASKLKIFICYATADREVAMELAQALRNDGHEVFVDFDTLRASEDFHDKIRGFIGSADRFVFLLSQASISEGKYTLSELDFARQRWPAPKGYVWPVLLDPNIDLAKVPAYLRSIQMLRPKGNVCAEVAAEMHRTRTLRLKYRIGALAAAAVLVSASLWSVTFWSGARFSMEPLTQVDFRPSVRPPEPGWRASDLAVTAHAVQYSSSGRATVFIQDETLRLVAGGREWQFHRFNEVEQKEGGIGCSDGWLCVKARISIEKLDSIRSTVGRETMFMPDAATPFSWQAFLQSLCDMNDDDISVIVESSAKVAGWFSDTFERRHAVCRIPVKFWREELQARNCKAETYRQFNLTENCSGK